MRSLEEGRTTARPPSERRQLPRRERARGPGPAPPTPTLAPTPPASCLPRRLSRLLLTSPTALETCTTTRCRSCRQNWRVLPPVSASTVEPPLQALQMAYFVQPVLFSHPSTLQCFSTRWKRLHLCSIHTLIASSSLMGLAFLHLFPFRLCKPVSCAPTWQFSLSSHCAAFSL